MSLKLIRNIGFFIKHKLMPQGLLARSMLIVIVPLTISTGVMSYWFYDNHWDTIGRRMAYNITDEISAVVAMLDEIEDYSIQKKIIKTASSKLGMRIDIMTDAVLEPGMEKLRNNWASNELKNALRTKLKQKNTFYIDEESSAPHIVVYLQYYSNVLAITIPYKRYFSTSAYVFIILMMGIYFVLFVIASLFMKNQVRSITKLSHAADEFGKGRDMYFSPSGALEVRQAGRAFLSMRGRIKKQLAERTYMLAGVSHDLRTPLTRMNLQLEMFEGGNEDLVEGLKDDVHTMQTMIDSYLMFIKGEGLEPFSFTDLAKLLEEVVDKFNIKSRQVELEIKTQISLNIRKSALTRGLNNIIANAVKYGKKAKVTCELEHNSAIITVDDDGPGIPEDKYDEVFKAFYRLDDSRNTKTGGIGLGLTIAKDMVASHNGEISLKPSTMGGLKVTIKLPV